MKSPLVTVVIPVYNTEKYLDRCIESIINQTYTSLEIILVDDGSVDNCPQMCDNWCDKDRRIKVIHKENAGRGNARNSGISAATGEYICFVDSDDFIQPETITECYSSIKIHNADIVSFGYRQLAKDGSVIKTQIPYTEKAVYEREEVIEKYLPDALGRTPETGRQHNISLSACFSLFSMKLLKENNFSFVSEREIISEDFYSMIKLFKDINKLVVIDKVFYNYCYNETSLTRQYRNDRYEKINKFYYDCIQLCDALGYPYAVRKRMWEPYFGNLMGHLKQLIASDEKESYKQKEFKRIINDESLQMIFRNIKYLKTERNIHIIIFLIKYRFTAIAYLLFKIRNLKG